jgi:hypothetical protein
MPSESTLQNEISTLRVRILALHTKAWGNRMKGDIWAMREAHRVIRAYKKRIRDCEWAIEYVHVGSAIT